MQLRIFNKPFKVPIDSFQWGNVYGLARTLLALGTFLTLSFNEIDVLFRQGVGVESYPFCDGVSSISLFCLLSNNLILAKIIAITVLVIVMLGVYPKITGVLHWWVSFSFMNSSIIVDGGDQITSVLTLLLIPICLTDNRKNHWLPSSNFKLESLYLDIKLLIAYSTLLVIKMQIALVYFQAAVAKFNVVEWANGTALYYWFDNTVLGASYWLSPFLDIITSNSFLVTILTWGIILLEILLFCGLFISQKSKGILLKVGVVFHFGIVIIFGLVSFFCAMSAALILFLRPFGKEFQLKFLKLKRVQTTIPLLSKFLTKSKQILGLKDN